MDMAGQLNSADRWIMQRISIGRGQQTEGSSWI